MKRILILFVLSAGIFSAQAQAEKSLDQIMDDWHQAAAEADAEAFFGRMTETGIYIGTDASERWLRDELREWSAKYFARESAWSFTALERNWQRPTENIAIADELLETGMGVCRSTAVLQLIDGEWYIVHYQLSIAVPNEKLEDFQNLMEKE